MGNALFGGLATKMLVEHTVDMLQEHEGLGQLGSTKWGLDKWNSKNTFGYDFSRNQAFKELVQYLKKPMKEGLKQAGIKPAEMNGFLENYIQVYLVNHIMRCLLASGEDIPEFQSFGLTEENFLKQPKLPKYSEESIVNFREQWTRVNDNLQLSIDTINDGEKELLSAKLASSVMDIVQNINITECVKLAATAHENKQQLAADNRNCLFTQTGNPQLQKNREEYTEKQQEADFKQEIRSALSNSST